MVPSIHIFNGEEMLFAVGSDDGARTAEPTDVFHSLRTNRQRYLGIGGGWVDWYRQYRKKADVCSFF